MYHDLGLKFCSPTINLFMESDDFVRFCERVEYYLSLDANEIVFNSGNRESYPIGVLDDIKMHFVHYENEDQVVEYWNRRRKRFNMKRLYFTMTDKDGCTDELRNRFLNLPYGKKVFFSCKKINEENVCYMPCFRRKSEVGGMTDYCNIFGKRYYAKYFDYVKWLGKRE